MNQFTLTKQPITEAEFSAFGQEIGFNLPEGYKHHMLKFNGGSPEKDCFKGLRIAHFNSIKYGNDTLEDNIEDFKEILPLGFLPFTYDWGGNPICIDLKNGKIYYCPMDMGEVEPEFLANSFQEFMDGLTEDCDY
jgi:hypothetical protein